MTASTAQPRRPVGRPSGLSPEILGLVVRRRTEGWRLEDICQVLNAAAIPTPGGGKRWWPSHVSRLLRTNTALAVFDEYYHRN